MPTKLKILRAFSYLKSLIVSVLTFRRVNVVVAETTHSNLFGDEVTYVTLELEARAFQLRRRDIQVDLVPSVDTNIYLEALGIRKATEFIQRLGLPQTATFIHVPAETSPIGQGSKIGIVVGK